MGRSEPSRRDLCQPQSRFRAALRKLNRAGRLRPDDARNMQASPNTDRPSAAPLCQSCGMPMQSPDHFGTTGAGERNDQYCFFCVRDGLFLEPEIGLERMIDKCVRSLVFQGVMPEAEARSLMSERLPRLKRWR